MQSFIKLELRDRGGNIEEHCYLYHEYEYTDHDLSNLVRKYKKEYTDNLKGRHYKWESYEYAKNALINNEGFYEVLTFTF